MIYRQFINRKLGYKKCLYFADKLGKYNSNYILPVKGIIKGQNNVITLSK